MKKILVLVLALGLVFGSITTAEAGKKKRKPKKVTREVQGGYDAPSLVAVGTCSQTGAIGCVAIVTGPKEKYLTATINDTHGLPAYVSIGADTDGDNSDDTSYGSFCGTTEEPIKIDPGTELHLWVGFQADPGFAGCVPGIATMGTIDVTLSNLP